VDGWYHVFHRGIERRAVFSDDRDREHFLDLLGEMHGRYRVVIHAFSLMDNHWHGVLQTPEANLSAAMQWLHLSHASWFNARHGRLGPLWQGRFGAVPIEDGIWAYEVSLYVHLNPVCTEEFGLGKRAKQVERAGWRVPDVEEVTRRLKALRQYPWSSYRAYGGYAKGPDWLQSRVLLERAYQEPKRREAAYRRDIRQRLLHGVEPSKEDRLRDAVAIGAERFVRQIKDLAGGGSRETSGKRELRRRVGFAEVIGVVERALGARWDEIRAQHGGVGRPLAMWAARRYGGLTLREVGDAMGGVDYAAVSMALKRLDCKRRNSRDLQTRMEQVAGMLNVET